jgi:hypothetical protein
MTLHDRLVALLISLFAAIFLFLWTRMDSPYSELGLNGFTECLGIGLTVLLIDRLLKRREAERTLPQRLAAYEDVRLLTARIAAFWHQAYMAAVPGPLPRSVAELCGTESINRLCALLNMDSQPNVTPTRTWWEYLPEQMAEFKRHAEVILERYNSILSPKAFLLIHKLLNALMDPYISRAIRASDLQMGFPRPRTLGHHLVLTDEYFPSVLALVSWCNTERQSLERESHLSLRGVPEALEGNRPEGIPRCMIAPEELQAQADAMQAYRARRDPTAVNGNAQPDGQHGPCAKSRARPVTSTLKL